LLEAVLFSNQKVVLKPTIRHSIQRLNLLRPERTGDLVDRLSLHDSK